MRTQEAILLDLSNTEVKIEKAKSKLAGIFVRFILTGIIVFKFWESQPPEATFLEKLLPSFAFIFCVYFLCWLFVFCLDLTRNYIICIIAVFVCLFGLAALVDYLGAKNPSLSNFLAVVWFFGFILMFFYDVYRVVMLPMWYVQLGNLKKEYSTSGGEIIVESAITATEPAMATQPIPTQPEQAVASTSTDFSSPAFIVRAAASLEKTLGRTPTDEEVNDFIADLAKE